MGKVRIEELKKDLSLKINPNSKVGSSLNLLRILDEYELFALLDCGKYPVGSREYNNLLSEIIRRINCIEDFIEIIKYLDYDQIMVVAPRIIDERLDFMPTIFEKLDSPHKVNLAKILITKERVYKYLNDREIFELINSLDSKDTILYLLSTLPISKALKIIAVNKYSEDYFANLLMTKLGFNASKEEKISIESYYEFFQTCIYMKNEYGFSFNIQNYLDSLESKIIESKEKKYILKCSLLDKELFSQIFNSKEEVLAYITLNDFSKEEISFIVNNFFTEEEIIMFNNRINDNIESLNNIKSTSNERFDVKALKHLY